MTFRQPPLNTTVQPVQPVLLKHSVKLHCKACVAAPASAVNTNTGCGHVLCDKSAEELNAGEEEETEIKCCTTRLGIFNMTSKCYWSLTSRMSGAKYEKGSCCKCFSKYILYQMNAGSC